MTCHLNNLASRGGLHHNKGFAHTQAEHSLLPPSFSPLIFVINRIMPHESPRPRLRPRDSTRDSRDSQVQWSQTQSRQSVDRVDVEDISEVVPPGRRKKGKSWRFGLAFFALAMVAFTSALDATSLSVALPVGSSCRLCSKILYAHQSM